MVHSSPILSDESNMACGHAVARMVLPYIAGSTHSIEITDAAE